MADSNAGKPPVYGAHKVSQYTHGRGYKVDETGGVPARASTRDHLYAQFEAPTTPSYKKRFTLEERRQETREQAQSMRDVFKEMSPRMWSKHWNYLRNLTPEEYETVLDCVETLKKNATIYIPFFLGGSLAFTYWQRMFLPKSFYFFAVFMGIFAGSMFAAIKTGTYAAVSIDKLGKEYEISRLMKQDIFDTRPDVDSAIRA